MSAKSKLNVQTLQSQCQFAETINTPTAAPKSVATATANRLPHFKAIRDEKNDEWNAQSLLAMADAGPARAGTSDDPESVARRWILQERSRNQPEKARAESKE